MKSCHFLIEHVSRELDIVGFVREVLVRGYGIKSTLSSIPFGGAVPRDSGVICVPYCYSGDDAGTNFLGREFAGVPVINLCYEQVLSKANFAFKRPRDAFARERVTHLAARASFADYLLESGVTSDRIRLTGHLPYAQYLDPYRRVYEGNRAVMAERFALDPDKTWVLLPENFQAAFFSEHEIQRRIRLGYSQLEATGYRDFAATTLAVVAKWLLRLCANPQVELIVRPRPAMPIDRLRNAIEAEGTDSPNNLHFIKEDSIRDWIFSCDRVISTYSSSLLESALADRPTRLLCPIEIPDFLSSDWNDQAPTIRSFEELEAFVLEADCETRSAPFGDWVRQEYFPQPDPIAEVASVIAESFQQTAASAPSDANPERTVYRPHLPNVMRVPSGVQHDYLSPGGAHDRYRTIRSAVWETATDSDRTGVESISPTLSVVATLLPIQDPRFDSATRSVLEAARGSTQLILVGHRCEDRVRMLSDHSDVVYVECSEDASAGTRFDIGLKRVATDWVLFVYEGVTIRESLIRSIKIHARDSRSGILSAGVLVETRDGSATHFSSAVNPFHRLGDRTLCPVAAYHAAFQRRSIDAAGGICRALGLFAIWELGLRIHRTGSQVVSLDDDCPRLRLAEATSTCFVEQVVGEADELAGRLTNTNESAGVESSPTVTRMMILDAYSHGLLRYMKNLRSSHGWLKGTAWGGVYLIRNTPILWRKLSRLAAGSAAVSSSSAGAEFTTPPKR